MKKAGIKDLGKCAFCGEVIEEEGRELLQYGAVGVVYEVFGTCKNHHPYRGTQMIQEVTCDGDIRPPVDQIE